MPVTECIAVYIRLSSEDNDVDGSIKAESNSVSAQRMLINEFIKKQDEFINCTDKDGDESCNGMVSGGNALLRRFGICTGKNTGINQTG